MSFSLYDATIPTYIQLLRSSAAVLAKGREHYESNGLNPDDLSTVSLCDDMLPLAFQINSIRHHSAGAIEGVRKGEFGPPPPLNASNYDALEAHIAEGIETVAAITADEVNGFVGQDMFFRMKSVELPFTAEGFLMSFSIPNFIFHATTAYDLLRMKGVPLGKTDYLGRPSLKG